MLLLLVLGFAFSFIGSVPMTGPLAAIVLERALSGVRRSATWIAASGSCVEGGIAAGLGAFVPTLLGHSETLIELTSVLGACVIVAVGLLLVSFPHMLGTLDTGRRRASVRTGVLATSLNPTLLATWTVVVTSLHGQDWIRGGLAQGLSFGLGVALGSFGWFVLMILAVRRLQTKDIARYRPQIMRAVGVILSGAGVVLLLRTLLAN